MTWIREGDVLFCVTCKVAWSRHQSIECPKCQRAGVAASVKVT